ncbi:hypothetical protein H257_15957 [Aphanomyces astaci]|uniref:Uncharacterized protein n=1 Tax=Aphanomyces astaci TaxID=112090 RepID=W4FME3_APHAT|nr:hypothetical protein H257_15957 [Aphanomyces astaci]ETV67999.1 hypothetical protein H257_15957 [Aphanomyces astaci]RQM20515.1 hypothetical protein B5M09_008589 [Aphanomyces astaci]|eukprot:XP_009842562.1 hypothetical protein H257_15957 [Aphanomyces astaci]
MPTNAKVLAHEFLKDLERDSYFPPDLVLKGKQLLRQLCDDIEEAKPLTPAGLLDLTHATTESFNELEEEFEARGSMLETVARDAIGSDIGFIAAAYGFDVDVEELISNREW